MHFEIKPCPECGVLVTPSLAMKNRRICKNCYKRQNKDNYLMKRDVKLAQRRAAWKEKNKHLERTETCIVCLKEFITTVAVHRTCSKECRVIAKKIRNRRYYKPKKEPEVKFCLICNKEFTTTLSRTVICEDLECARLHKNNLTRESKQRVKERRNGKNSNNDKRKHKSRKGLLS